MSYRYPLQQAPYLSSLQPAQNVYVVQSQDNQPYQYPLGSVEQNHVSAEQVVLFMVIGAIIGYVLGIIIAATVKAIIILVRKLHASYKARQTRKAHS